MHFSLHYDSSAKFSSIFPFSTRLVALWSPTDKFSGSDYYPQGPPESQKYADQFTRPNSEALIKASNCNKHSLNKCVPQNLDHTCSFIGPRSLSRNEEQFGIYIHTSHTFVYLCVCMCACLPLSVNYHQTSQGLIRT